MKTTNIQKEIITTCISELIYWYNSNDIHSPTHVSDAQAELDKFYYDNKLSDEDCEEINKALQNLRYTILKITDNGN